MSESLLPPNATPLERALELSSLRMTAMPLPLRELWRYQDCPAHLLPWLAWALGVDDWSPAWSEGTKRIAIRDALLVQQRKGTLWALKQAVLAAGHGSARVIEGNGGGHTTERRATMVVCVMVMHGNGLCAVWCWLSRSGMPTRTMSGAC